MRAKALSETMGRWVSEGSVMAASVATRIVGLCERLLVAPAISPVQEVVAQRRITRLFWQFGDDSWLLQPGPVSRVLRLSPSSFKTGHEARWSRTSVPKGVAWNRRPSPFGGSPSHCRLRHHRTTAKEYCPSSSAAARQQSQKTLFLGINSTAQ